MNVCITESLCHIPETIDIINQLYSNKILKQIQRKKKSFTKNRILRECDSVSRSWMGEGICMLICISAGDLGHVWGSIGLGHDLCNYHSGDGKWLCSRKKASSSTAVNGQ